MTSAEMTAGNWCWVSVIRSAMVDVVVLIQ